MKYNSLQPRDEPNKKVPRVGKVSTDHDRQVNHDNAPEFSGLPRGLQRVIALLEGGDPTSTISTENTQAKGKHGLADDHINTPNLPSGKSYPRPK